MHEDDDSSSIPQLPPSMRHLTPLMMMMSPMTMKAVGSGRLGLVICACFQPPSVNNIEAVPPQAGARHAFHHHRGSLLVRS
jgi:hypothetical protein